MNPVEASLLKHDAALRQLGLSLWLGSEPTFTDRHSQAPEWLSEASGRDKEMRARRLLSLLAAAHPGAAVLRTVGRQYAGETRPRFSYGLYARRDGEPSWYGPPDLLLPGDGDPGCTTEQVRALQAALVHGLQARAWRSMQVPAATETELRLVFRTDGAAPELDAEHEPSLQRESIHSHALPTSGLHDVLAAKGDHLLLIILAPAFPEGPSQVWVELPEFEEVSQFVSFLSVLSQAASEAKLPSLGLRGFPPPVDASVAWTTLTPDPAVLEVNHAPAPDVKTFLDDSRTLYDLAESVGLCPYRLRYNGQVTDSGGGGQLTFGGPTPTLSPFFSCPRLLPRLVRYLVRHPSLSYWFATHYVGGSSQSPRPDEGPRDAFLELEVALEQLAALPAPSPEMIWSALQHFLCDASGNPHRSELNIEKLWNRSLPGRGCLGLVEFRALGMARDPERATALGVLLRSLLAALSQHDLTPKLIHWGDTLHERFALPYFLRRDLQEVFADLALLGLGIDQRLQGLLLEEKSTRLLGRIDLPGARLELIQALEFWPLVGDSASQERGGSRLVDASTARLELRLSSIKSGSAAAVPNLAAWQIAVNGYRLPLRIEDPVDVVAASEPSVDTRGSPVPPTADPSPAVRVFSVRYRNFVPTLGLHPSIGTQTPITITLEQTGVSSYYRLVLHDWRPDGSAYPGLPRDLADAAARREERLVLAHITVGSPPRISEPPAKALSPYCLDLRRV